MQNAPEAGFLIQAPYSYMLCIESHLHYTSTKPYARDLSVRDLYLALFTRTPYILEYAYLAGLAYIKNRIANPLISIR